MRSTEEQFQAVLDSYPGSTLTAAGSGIFLVHLPVIALPDGWSQQRTEVRFVVPNGYPHSAPDCFWADGALRLRDRRMPQNAQIGQAGPGQPDPGLLWFSWHVAERWKPTTCDLITYVNIIKKRFEAVV
jgi:hypothetical protein